MIISDATGLTRGSEVKVQVKCNFCGKISVTNYANYWNSQERRGWPQTTFCRPCACKISATKRKGKPAHNKGKKLDPSQKGSNHPMWKGGRYLSSDGYVMVHIGGEKQEIGWSSYKKEHVVVLEKMLGRPMGKNEIIHHIDGQKTHNELGNLWITSSSGHRNAHCSLQKIGYQLYRLGIVGFNRETGQYFLNGELCTT